MARQGVAWRGLERIGMAGEVRSGMAWRGEVWTGKARNGRNGVDRHGSAWSGMGRQEWRAQVGDGSVRQRTAGLVRLG